MEIHGLHHNLCSATQTNTLLKACFATQRTSARVNTHTHTHVRKIGAEKQSKKCVKRKNISQTGLGENAHTTANSSKKRKLQLKNAHARASRNL